MPATLQFEFRMPRGQPRSDGTTRLLLLGDFSNRAQRGHSDPASIAKRPAIKVDIDTFDRVLGRLAPVMPIKLDDKSQHELHPVSLDDFHPDRLTAALPPLQRLASLRRRLLDPKQFAAAAAELSAVSAAQAPGGGPATGAAATSAALTGGGPAGSATSAGTAPPAQATAESDTSALNRLLGGQRTAAGPAAASSVGAAPGSAAPGTAAAVDAIIRRALAATDLVPELKFQAQHVAAVDATASSVLRSLLHRPEFQRLEAAWRGVSWLVNNLELGEELELYLLDVSLDELRADAAAAPADTPDSSGLARQLAALAADAQDEGASWGLAAGLYSVEPEDIDLLDRLGAAAQGLRAPLVLGAGPQLAGIGPDPSEWTGLPDAPQARWQSLRESAAAAYLALAAPRILLRLPYAPDTDAIESFAFAELARAVPAREELLWGEAPLAAMLAYGRSLSTGAEAAQNIEDLPALSFTDDGERHLQPCAEWLVSERVGIRMSQHGVMPLLGSRHRNAVRLAAWHALIASRSGRS
jgi:type VI secretion system protein ImpC